MPWRPQGVGATAGASRPGLARVAAAGGAGQLLGSGVLLAVGLSGSVLFGPKVQVGGRDAARWV